MNFMKQFSYTTSASYGDFWRKMHQFFFFFFFINTKFIQEIIFFVSKHQKVMFAAVRRQ